MKRGIIVGVKLTYETAVATFIQFVALSLLNIATGASSVITTCRSGHDCVSNLIVSMIFFMLIVAWFAAVWILGYAVQERRSRRLAKLLIAAEAVIAMVAFFNARHHTDFLSLFTSIVDLVLAVWVILLAFRLMRAGGGRVVTGRNRPRQRRS